MKSTLKDYISGEKNVIKDEFVISRERLNGNEMVCISHSELTNPLYSFWGSGRKNDIKTGPKHTGGKKPYVMIMIQELVKLLDKGLPPHVVGHLLYLVPFIDWETSRLVIGRKKKPMMIADIMNALGKSRSTADRIIAELKKYNLLAHRPEGYFISRSLVKKGGAKFENKV